LVEITHSKLINYQFARLNGF